MMQGLIINGPLCGWVVEMRSELHFLEAGKKGLYHLRAVQPGGLRIYEMEERVPVEESHGT
jgi:hypothetical protein